jgi:hypothetical protein
MFSQPPSRRTILALLSVALLVVSMAVATATAAEVTERRTADTLSWAADFQWDHAVLTVSGPAGVRSWVIAPESGLSFAIDRLAAWARAARITVEGSYVYELSFAPRISDEEAVERTRRRADEEGSGPATHRFGELPKTSGTFRIQDGVVVGAESTAPERSATTKDVLHYDDVIVTGSLCLGFDCVDGESFGYCTQKLKENNLQLCFEDTSTGAFPTRDWKIQINDTTSGGADYFTIWDTDSGRRPFTIEGGAPAHSLYVEDYGRVGLGTSVPFVELHIVDGDSPTVRLGQDSSAGWAAQAWDLAGNETNFFIRDVTNGSKLSFRIQPGAPSNTLSLKSDGKVGVGTWSPTAKLELETTGEPANLLLDRTDGGQWYLTSMADGTFTIGASGIEGEELLILDDMGNLTTSGTVNGISDRAAKSDFRPVDQTAILDAIVELAISDWRLVKDPEGVRHIGPTAQDFRASFGLGADDRHIALSDMSGVALAAIQALAARLEARDAEIDQLSRRLAELEARLAASN